MAPVYAKHLAIQILKETENVDGAELLLAKQRAWDHAAVQSIKNGAGLNKKSVNGKGDRNGHRNIDELPNNEPAVFHSKFHW